MGTDVTLQLVDWQAYERVLLVAHRAFLERNDTSALVQLLLVASDQALEQNDRPKPGDVRAAMSVLGTDFEAARKGMSEQEASEEAEAAVLARLRGEPRPRLLTKPDIKEVIDVLQGGATSVDALHHTIRVVVMPGLMEALCLVWRAGVVAPAVDVGRSPLGNYLRRHSEYLTDALSGRAISGGLLALSTGGSSERFTHDETERISEALSTVPQPKGPWLRLNWEELRQLVRLALDRGTELALVLTYSC